MRSQPFLRRPLSRVALALSALIAKSAPAWAAGLQSAGTATRTVLFTDCYELEVFDPDGSLTKADLDAPDQPIKIQITAKYDGDMPKTPDGWRNEIKPELGSGDWSALQDAYDSLGEGDVVSVSFTPGSGTTVEKNGSVVAKDPG